jgi:DNA-binding HxlR family transcriptional regulator
VKTQKESVQSKVRERAGLHPDGQGQGMVTGWISSKNEYAPFAFVLQVKLLSVCKPFRYQYPIVSAAIPPKTPASFIAAPRRSPCPVSCSLDLLGDKWTLLVVRDLILGRARFKEFVASPERIPTNILSDRLERLCQAEVVQQVPASDGSKRMAYELTPKGKALRPLIVAMKNWGLRWMDGSQALLKPN